MLIRRCKVNNSYVQEMARALHEQLGTPLEDALAVLGKYWEDKVADVWSLGNFIGLAVEKGYPITRELALQVADEVQDNINPELGISWLTLQVAIEDNCALVLRDLPPEQRALVYGVFAVWRAKDDSGYQFGSFDEFEQLGNLTKAMEQAEAFAQQEPGEPVFLACIGSGTPTNVPPVSLGLQPALVVYKDPDKDRVTIEDGRLFTGRESLKTVV
jgi:hypothetical protein